MSNYYTYSKDYELLADMVEAGEHVPVTLDYQATITVLRDIAGARCRNGMYDIGARGIGYNDICETRPEFITECKRLQVEFIEPNKYDEGISQAQRSMERDKWGLAE